MELRHRLGFTQAELGEMLGVHEVSVRPWEGDTQLPARDMLVKLAEVGNVSIDWLLERTAPEDDLRQMLADQQRLLGRQQQHIEDWLAQQKEQSQSSGKSSKAVHGAISAEGSPTSGSYT